MAEFFAVENFMRIIWIRFSTSQVAEGLSNQQQYLHIIAYYPLYSYFVFFMSRMLLAGVVDVTAKILRIEVVQIHYEYLKL